jgi:hypothetical protein
MWTKPVLSQKLQELGKICMTNAWRKFHKESKGKNVCRLLNKKSTFWVLDQFLALYILETLRLIQNLFP